MVMDQAAAKAKNLKQKLEEALVTIRAPGTFIYDFHTFINSHVSFAERSASSYWIRGRPEGAYRQLLPVDPHGEGGTSTTQERRCRASGVVI